MTWLVLGLVIWCAAHLFKRVLPRQREALGNKGRALVALLVAAGLGLMIFGYRAAETEFLYALPMWTWELVEMAVINRAEGPWTPPERGSYAKDAMMLAAAAVLFAVIAGIHHWFGYSVIAALN